MSDLERITACRSELDALAEELAKHLQEVEAEWEELGIAERVLRRFAERDRADTGAAEAAAPVKAQVAGRAVLPIPHRGETGDKAALPADLSRSETRFWGLTWKFPDHRTGRHSICDDPRCRYPSSPRWSGI
ncbi:hypothetical protein OHA79_01505 [Streptomyces sp. NBC_00841]|uniref:hypothetical protein n=1 Tax=Streptomyces sp. NBC_00841 TaxID=2975847 RepID=UPI002DD946D8|nr:hypothetical protein [Streptomyces sp. NBC_00841]WRZ96738.1 hypothetical protein OHA79_01505 [Streptomyces sp. NBC_00841]